MCETRVLVELFTASHLEQLAWYGESEVLRACVPLVTSRGTSKQHINIAELLDAAFEILSREYPVEYVFKTHFLRRRLFGVHSPNTAALYMEFPVGTARADMLLVNGDATAVEVKSRYDGPARLAGQLKEYYRCFKSVAVLVDEREVSAYLDILPPHVGVYALTRRSSIGVRRAAVPDGSRLTHRNLFRLLRRDEYLDILAGEGFDLSSTDPAERFQVGLECFSQLSLEAAYEHLTLALRHRQATKRMSDLCRALPESLHVGAFSFRLRSRDWDNLLNVLTERVVRT